MVKKVHSLIDALSRNTEVKYLIEKENNRHSNAIQVLEEEYNELASFIVNAKSTDNLAEVVGESYIDHTLANNTTTMTRLAREFKRVIDTGELPKLIENDQDISYWYDSGFREGNIRHMKRGMGESNAVPLGSIRLSDDLYTYKEKLTDSVLLALLAYADKINYDVGNLDEGTVKKGDQVKSKGSGKTYDVIESIEGHFEIVKTYIPNTRVPDKTTWLNNWLMQFYTVEKQG